jgi:hypothetical protein
MKKVLLGSLLASGLLLAANKDNYNMKPRLNYDEQVALASQSPRVHPARMDKHKKADQRTDHVTTNKNTVVAVVPYGK